MLRTCMKHFEAHVNGVKLSKPPFLHESQQPESSESERRDYMPWIGTKVLVCKVGHARKGYHGVVRGVLPRQPTFSGLRVQVRFTHISPDGMCEETLDYDDVVESTYKISILFELFYTDY